MRILKVKNIEKYLFHKGRASQKWHKFGIEMFQTSIWLTLDSEGRELMLVTLALAVKNGGYIDDDVEYLKKIGHLNVNGNYSLEALIDCGFLEIIGNVNIDDSDKNSFTDKNSLQINMLQNVTKCYKMLQKEKESSKEKEKIQNNNNLKSCNNLAVIDINNISPRAYTYSSSETNYLKKSEAQKKLEKLGLEKIFEECWEIHGIGNKEPARKSFLKAFECLGSGEVIKSAVIAYKSFCEKSGKTKSHLSTFLNQNGWERNFNLDIKYNFKKNNVDLKDFEGL